jgi:hypothetical protein
MAFVALVSVMPAKVGALGTETLGNAPVVKQPDWAEGVVDVVNLKSRVYSQWVNGNENFFYRGDSQAANEAIRHYALIKDDVRELILLPGSGRALTFDRKPVDFDWQLQVPSGIYRAVSKRRHAVMTVYINGAKPRAAKDRKQFEVWLGELNHDSFATRAKAKRELEKLGYDAKPFLREALRAQPAIEARRQIEGLLEKLKDFEVGDLELPEGISVRSVDDLLAENLEGLKDKAETVRGMAMQDLSGLADYSDKVVPAMTDMLRNDRSEWVRLVAAGCLGHIGVKAKSAMPALKDRLNDPDANIRKAFQATLDQLENAEEKPGQEEEVRKRIAILQEIRAFMKAARRK